MADEYNIEIDGLIEFIMACETAEDDLIDAVMDAMNTYTLLVETGGKALAHRFSGELEESIKASAAAIENGMVVGAVGSNLSYAWIRHEQPYRPGTHDMYDRGVLFKKYYLNGRGRRTHRKSKWRGQLPGRKYLERAVNVTEGNFETIMTRAMEQILGGLA